MQEPLQPPPFVEDLTIEKLWKLATTTREENTAVRKPAYKAFKLDDKELKSALGADGHFGAAEGPSGSGAGVYRAII